MKQHASDAPANPNGLAILMALAKQGKLYNGAKRPNRKKAKR